MIPVMPLHCQKKSISLFLAISVLGLFAACKEPLPELRNYDITCYAATYGKGIYRTENGGRSWFPLTLDQDDLHAYFKRIYLHPRERNILYVATTGAGMFRVDLRMNTLRLVNGFENDNVRSVAFSVLPSPNPGSSMEMLVATKNTGILRACDESDPWVPCNQSLTYRDVNVIFSHKNLLFAGTAKDLFRWDENSEQWMPASEGIRNRNILSLGADSGGKILYAGSGGYSEERGFFQEIPCLYKSTNQGQTWSPSDKGIPDGTLVFTIAVNPGRPERIYLGTSDGIYRSTEGGQTWQKMEQGLPKEMMVFDIKVARMPDGKDVVYAATAVGVFMTADDDETQWVSRNYGLEPTAITSILLVTN